MLSIKAKEAIKTALPDLPDLFDELDGRFEEIQRLVGGSPPAREVQSADTRSRGEGRLASRGTIAPTETR